MGTICSGTLSRLAVIVGMPAAFLSLLVAVATVHAADDPAPDILEPLDSPVFARLGDAVLTQADIDAYIQDRVPEEHRSSFLSSSNRITELVQEQMLTHQLAHRAAEHDLLHRQQFSIGL